MPDIDDINVQLDKEIDELLGIQRVYKKTILVLSGGGLKGITQLGCLEALKQQGHLKYIDTIAGTSAGAIVATLYIAGYQPTELYDFLVKFDISKMTYAKTVNMLEKYGLDDGKRCMIILERLIKAKKFDADITFREFYKRTKIKLIITGTCLNEKKAHYFSVDTQPDMSVLIAVRISVSIPIIFAPYKFENNLFVDGGCIDNYPIQLFKDKLDRVIGVYVCDKNEPVEKIENIEDFLLSLIHCLFEGVNHNSSKGYEKFTIKINVLSFLFSLCISSQQFE